MESKGREFILDFETLFSDFQEFLNGSGLRDVTFVTFSGKNVALSHTNMYF